MRSVTMETRGASREGLGVSGGQRVSGVLREVLGVEGD